MGKKNRPPNPSVRIEAVEDRESVFVDIKSEDGLIPAEAAKSIAILLTDAAIEAMGRPREVSEARAAFLSIILQNIFRMIDTTIGIPLCEAERRVFLGDIIKYATARHLVMEESKGNAS